MRLDFSGDKMVLAHKRRGYFCVYVVMLKWTPTDGGSYWIPVMSFHDETALFNSRKEARARRRQLAANGKHSLGDMYVAKLGVIR